MAGRGSSNGEALRAELSQSFEVKTPMGTMRLRQSVQARRLGNC
jgi:hypothetical protein